MRACFVICLLTALAACGSRDRGPSGITYASGPVSDACEAGGRDKASRPLCQCVQGVANRTLTARDQTRAAAFFADPQLAQDTRQSDNPLAEAFWRRYRVFTDAAEEICAAVV
ncbi:MAG: arginine transporter [Pseudomonadota bacterium]